MSKKRYCLQCDDGTPLAYKTKDQVIAMDGLSATVPAVAGWHCPKCGECEFDEGEGERFNAALSALRKQADEARRHEMRAIRKKLGLPQAEAGRIFGGGASAFSEYERGKTRPHKSTVLLLRLLDHHPELLDEIKASESTE